MSNKSTIKSQLLFFASYFFLLFSYLLYINFYYLEGIPHVPDSVAYLFMAKMFATGHIILPIPANPDHFRFFDGTLNVSGGKWLFQYPFGHPLLLTIGVLLGIPQAISPLIGTLMIAELSVIVSMLYAKKTLFFLLPLPFISPFFIENSASFMSHTTAAFYLTSAVLFILLALKQDRIMYYILSGISVGLLFNTRPLTALPFFLFFALLLYVKRKENTKWCFSLLYYSIGFAWLFSLWMLYNVYTTGSPFISQYFEVNKGIFGFGHSDVLSLFLRERFANVSVLTKNFFPMLYNLPISITIVLLCGLLFNAKKSFWDIFFFISLFLLPITYFFYNGTFLMYGPRFWYEMLPFAFIVTARTMEFFYEKFGKSILVIGIILIFISLMRFYSVIPVQNPDFFSPLKINDLNGFNFVDNRIVTTVQKNNIHHAVVFIEECHGNWWCYGSVFSQNSPFLTTDIVYVRDLGKENKKIINKYPTRKYYKINYDTSKIEKIE